MSYKQKETVARHVAVKCVVWDLDNTLWNGVLLEDKEVILRQDAIEAIRTLDSRGILNSIASKNDFDLAMNRLKQAGIDEYFLYPQINWNAKSSSIRTIANKLNIGLDTFAFVDDQPFEIEEVAFSLPDVFCIPAEDIPTLIALPEMRPRFITEDSAKRRQMYISDAARNHAEEVFQGPQEEFLTTLGMKLMIMPALEEDLRRAEELTVRTHQLNTTGYTYSYEDLKYCNYSGGIDKGAILGI